MVETLLRRIGKACFINCFDEFSKALPLTELIEVMHLKGGAETEHSARVKAQTGMKIVESGLTRLALESVANSTRVEADIIAKARKLLKSNV